MRIERAFSEHARVMAEAAATLPAAITAVADRIRTCLLQGHTVLACGNGGSAADAEHLVAELVGRFRDERRGLPALALTGNGSLLTALANDFGYERVFARQVEALARAGDVLIAISTSGNSANVVEAARAARARRAIVVALTGRQGGLLAAEADAILRAPAEEVARIQEVHGFCIHALVDELEARIAAGSGP